MKAGIFASIIVALLSQNVAVGAPTCSPDAVYSGPAKRKAVSSDVFTSSQLDVSNAIDGDLAAKLTARFEELVSEKTEATSASIAVWAPSLGYWSAETGEKSDDGYIYWWASVGKLITSTIIFQLVEAGEIDLSTPISRWFPSYPEADLITIDHLLTHTGGVFSFNTDKKFQKQKTRTASVEKLLKLSARHGADFCPGEHWNYSNTGYVMLSHIAEKVSGRSFADLVEEQIADALELHQLAVVTSANDDSQIVAPHGARPPSKNEIASIYGAGAIKSDAEDMIVLLAAYLDGRLVSTDSRDLAVADLYPMFGSTMHYGRGVMVTDVPDPVRPTTWIGHAGGSPNAKALLVYDTERNVYAALVLNTQAPAEALLNDLLKIIDAHGSVD